MQNRPSQQFKREEVTFKDPSHGNSNRTQSDWLPENTIEIEQQNLLQVAERICQQCRYPLLALRILIHILCGIDETGQITINARRLAKTLDVHYDTVTKCLKYLRKAGVISK